MSNIFTASDYDGHDLYGKIKKLIYIYENGKKQRINNYKAEYLMIKPRLNYY